MKVGLIIGMILSLSGCKDESKDNQSKGAPGDSFGAAVAAMQLASIDLDEKGAESSNSAASRDILRIPAKTGQIRLVCHLPETQSDESQVAIVAIAETDAGAFRTSKIAPRSCLRNMSIALGKQLRFNQGASLTMVVISNGRIQEFRADRILQSGGGKWSVPGWRSRPSRPVASDSDPSRPISNLPEVEQVAPGFEGTLPSQPENPPVHDQEDPQDQKPQIPPDCDKFPDGRLICQIK